jgi:hypothetical protein
VEPLRIGVLGAARISELSIVGPATATGSRLVAVAARDRHRAEAFADKHGIERVHASYADVIADPEVEAIYNPLANSLHAPWNKGAILAGKHVLTEKPFASNTTEAVQVRDLARGRSVVLFEGFHYLYHPLTKRLMSLLAGGELGTLQRVESTRLMTAPPADDPRWSLERAGAPGVDESAEAHLEFPSGATGLARCSMASDDRIIITSAAGERSKAAATPPRTPTSSKPSSGPSGAARPTAPMPTTPWPPCRSSTTATAPWGSHPVRRTPDSSPPTRRSHTT